MSGVLVTMTILKREGMQFTIEKKKSKVMEKTAKVLKLSKEFYKILNLTSIF